MAGKVKLLKIDTREARAKLAARGQPYYVEVLSGLHIGYRKGARRGVWVTRRWVGDRYEVETLDGVADDVEPADGEHVLSFDQARRAALKMADEAAKEAKGHAQCRRTKAPPYTVADAVENYLSYLDRETKSGPRSRAFANLAILPKLGHIKLRDLTKEILNNWLFELAASSRRTRSKTLQPPPPATDEERRRRRSSANRGWGVLSAALNYAFEEKHIDSDAAWSRVKPLREASAARMRWLSADEMRRLVAAADEPFRSLVVAALHSGCRYGELCRLAVEDFDARADSLLIRVSKSGKPRRVTLTRDASAFFKGLCAGRSPHEIMLRRADGSPWGVGHQDKPMRAACAKAGIERANFHSTRHSFASHAVMDGVSLLIVSRLLGHGDTKMCEKFYAHLCPDHVRETIQSRRKPLELVDADDSNVVPLQR